MTNNNDGKNNTKEVNNEPKRCDNLINDTSFLDRQNSTKEIHENLFLNKENDEERNEISNTDDKIVCTLLAHINENPASYKEAMQTKEREMWKEAINDELNSMNKNEVWEIVNRSVIIKGERKPNIIDSRWVLKRKLDKNGSTKYEAR